MRADLGCVHTVRRDERVARPKGEAEGERGSKPTLALRHALGARSKGDRVLDKTGWKTEWKETENACKYVVWWREINSGEGDGSGNRTVAVPDSR